MPDKLSEDSICLFLTMLKSLSGLQKHVITLDHLLALDGTHKL